MQAPWRGGTAIPTESGYRNAPGTKPSAAVRPGPVVELELQQDEVEPAAELRAELVHPTDLEEAEPLVEAHRSFVLAVDRGHHRVLAEGAGRLDQCVHELAADARAPVVLTHMDRAL